MKNKIYLVSFLVILAVVMAFLLKQCRNNTVEVNEVAKKTEDKKNISSENEKNGKTETSNSDTDKRDESKKGSDEIKKSEEAKQNKGNVEGDVSFIIESEEEFEKILASNKPKAIMFGASYCHNCTKMKPYVEEYANLYRNKIDIRYVDILENSDIAYKYPVDRIPTVIYIDSKGNPFMPSDNIKKYNFYPFAKKGSQEIALMTTIGLINKEVFKDIIEEFIESDK